MVIELLAWLLNCYVVTELIVFSELCTQKTKPKKCFSQIPMLSSKRVHVTWLAVRIHSEVFFGEIDPDLLNYGPAFHKKGVHIKCNDKIEITEGHRRLILNIVTKIRNLKLKSKTA